MEKDTLSRLLRELEMCIETEEAQLKLQELIMEHSSLIKFHKGLQSQLLSLSKRLQKFQLRAYTYGQIQVSASRFACNKHTEFLTRSIHDSQGKFLWMEQSAGVLFNRPIAELKRTSLFQLMNARSRVNLAARHGRHLLDDEKPKVISYLLEDKSTFLTSRCSLVKYSRRSVQEDCILVETRVARHKVPSPANNQISLLSPLARLNELNTFNEHMHFKDQSFSYPTSELSNISPYIKKDWSFTTTEIPRFNL